MLVFEQNVHEPRTQVRRGRLPRSYHTGVTCNQFILYNLGILIKPTAGLAIDYYFYIYRGALPPLPQLS